MKNTNIASTISLIKEELSKAIIGLDNELKNVLSSQEKAHIGMLKALCEDFMNSYEMTYTDSDEYYGAQYKTSEGDNYYISDN